MPGLPARVWRNPTAGPGGCQRRSRDGKRLPRPLDRCEYRRGVPGAPPLLVCAGRSALDAWIVRRVRERVKSDISGPAVAGRRVPGGHALGAVLGTLFLRGGLSVGGCGSVSGGLHAETEALLAATVVPPDAPKPAPDTVLAEPVVAAATATPDAHVEGGAGRARDEAVMGSAEPIVGAAGATEGEPELLPMASITDATMTPYLVALAETMTVAHTPPDGAPRAHAAPPPPPGGRPAAGTAPRGVRPLGVVQREDVQVQLQLRQVPAEAPRQGLQLHRPGRGATDDRPGLSEHHLRAALREQPAPGQVGGGGPRARA